MNNGVSDRVITPGLMAVFGAERELPAASLGIDLAKSAARAGLSTLLIDGAGDAAAKFGIEPKRTLSDVIEGRAALRDVKYVAAGAGITITAAGHAELGELLGPIAALSLSYDCVIVIAPCGCTPDHVRLAGAADASAMIFHSESDRFMRAYWMLDAVRAASPSFDPFMVGVGSRDEVLETYDLLSGTVRDFLGGPPPLGGIIDNPDDAAGCANYIIEAVTRHARRAHYA